MTHPPHPDEAADAAEGPGGAAESSSRHGVGASAEASSATSGGDLAKEARKTDPPRSTTRSRGRWWWVLPVAAVVEFWFYGYRGHIEACVGKRGETDFDLVGKERTDENRWRFPRCEQRINLGLRSNYDARVEEAVRVACRGATLFRHQGEQDACMEGRDGWEVRIDTSHCPPWHAHYYEHLFWFLQ